MQLPDLLTPASEWEEDAWLSCKQEVIAEQSRLYRVGVAKMLPRFLAHTSDPELVLEAVHVGNALLLGGNQHVQEAFLRYFHRDVLEGFFAQLFYRLSWCQSQISERKREIGSEVFTAGMRHVAKQEHEALSEAAATAAARIDAADSNSSDGGAAAGTGTAVTKRVDTKASEVVFDTSRPEYSMVQPIMRLMQLLCEGHNVDMQRYMHAQISSLKNYDLVTLCAELFDTLARHLDRQTLPVLIQIVRTLTEMCQGPCVENQVILTETKVIYTCSTVLRWSPQDLRNRGLSDLSGVDDYEEDEAGSGQQQNKNPKKVRHGRLKIALRSCQQPVEELKSAVVS